MLFDPNRIRSFYMAVGYTDMRKQIDGLVGTVRLLYGKDVNEESLFLFCGRRSDRIKALYFDGTGYVLLYKRLVKGRFQWPRNSAELRSITPQQFRWLMEGLKIEQRTVLRETEPGRIL